jgi:hypothetical protein
MPLTFAWPRAAKSNVCCARSPADVARVCLLKMCGCYCKGKRRGLRGLYGPVSLSTEGSVPKRIERSRAIGSGPRLVSAASEEQVRASRECIGFEFVREPVGNGIGMDADCGQIGAEALLENVP